MSNGEPFKYNPRLTSKPGEPVEVSVDIPEDENGRESRDDIFSAMKEAARLVFGDDFLKEDM